MQGGCLSLEAGKSDPAVVLKPHQHGKTTKSEQLSLILGGEKSTRNLQLELNEYFWQRLTYERHFMDSINNF